MDLVLLGWLAFQLTDSPFMVGLAAFARSAPLMVLGPFTGILADRMHRGHVLIATQCLGLVTALALAAVFAAGRGGFGPLVGLEMLFGVLWALDFPARRTALYALVGPRRVATAVSLETVSMQVAKMVGPVLAGIELARLGPAPCYVGVAVLYVVGLLVFAGLPARIGGPGRRDTISMAASLGAGFREAWRQPTVRAVLIVTVMMNVLFFPYQHMLPVFAREVLRVGPEWLGALVAADGLGALLGALAIAGRRGFLPHGRVFALCVLVAPFLLLAFTSVRWPWACLPLVLIGACESGFAAMQSTLVLLSAPEASRGRAMGILSACIGTQPTGSLWIGFLAGGIGVAGAMALNGTIALLAMLRAAWPLARRAGRGALLTDLLKYPSVVDRSARAPGWARPVRIDSRLPGGLLMKMMRVVLALVLVLAVSLSLPGAISIAQEVLTNDSVIQMVKGGLPAAVVIAKIKSTPSKFDLRTDSLVSLKKAGVTDEILEAMVSAGSGGGAASAPSSSGTAAMPAPPAPAMAAGALKTQDVIYQLVGGKYVEMFATSANLETNMAFFQSKSEVVLEGRKAQFRISDKQPVFLSTYSSTDAPLVRFKPGDEHNDRNLKIGSGAFMPFGGTQKMGVRNEDKIAVTIERDPRGFYKVTPSAALPPGEYGFILATGFGAGSGKVYDFGVD
jgi:MFS family permease